VVAAAQGSLAIGRGFDFIFGRGEETCFLRVLEHVRERPSALPEGDSSVVWALRSAGV
jgi:hypothetical protein